MLARNLVKRYKICAKASFAGSAGHTGSVGSGGPGALLLPAGANSQTCTSLRWYWLAAGTTTGRWWASVSWRWLFWSCTSLGWYRLAQVALAVAVTALGLYLANLLGWTNNKVFLVDFSCFTPPERCASASPGAFLLCQCFGRASFLVHHRTVYVLLLWRAAMCCSSALHDDS